MDYLTRQADIYGLNIRVVFGTFRRVSHYEVINKNKEVLACIYDVNAAYWLQKDGNFMSGLPTRGEILIIK